MLKVQNICKQFYQQEILNNVSLAVNQGDVVVILGPSGSGKTTFLRCLNGLERADSGTLKINQQKYDLAEIKKKEITQIRKKPHLFFNTTIYLRIRPLWKMSWRD